MNTVNGGEEIIQAGELLIRPGQYTVSARGQVVVLSVREFQLVVVLARVPGRIVTREQLYADVWGGEMDKSDRSVDVYVHKLRTKLARALPEWRFIHTHHGFGYRWHPERSQVLSNSATTP
ncbi:MAG: winged helix-turn-helix domain-containing protein [Solirubrobacteraceae bacterium]